MSSLANLKREIKRLGIISDEKISLLSYFTGNKDRQADALSCLGDLEDKEKCTYLRSLILTTSCCQTTPGNTQVTVEKPTAIVQKSLPLQDAEVVVDPANEPSISTESIPNDTHLPENASHFLRYYEIWDKPYDKWLSLHEYSEYLRDIKKDRVHDSFKKEIGILKKLFSKDHPAQLRLAHLESQLKMQQIPRNTKKIRKRKSAQLNKLFTKKNIVKEKIEIAKDSLVVGRYNRINQHYEDFHEIGLQLVKRNLSVDNDYPEFDHGKVKKAKK